MTTLEALERDARARDITWNCWAFAVDIAALSVVACYVVGIRGLLPALRSAAEAAGPDAVTIVDDLDVTVAHADELVVNLQTRLSQGDTANASAARWRWW